MKLYLSPSTQEHNVGAGSYGTEEAYCNHLADLMVPRLTARGIIVYRNDPNKTLGEAVAESNRLQPDLHLAIHTNAMGGAASGKAMGCEVYIHKRGGRSEPFANLLYKKIADMTPWADRGVREGLNHYGAGKHMYETFRTDAPATLIEIDFHDRGDSVLWLLRNAESIAAAMCAAIEEWAGLPALTDSMHDILAINRFLANKGEHTLSLDYWPGHAKAGQTCDGGYVADAFRRIATALGK